MDAIEIYSLLCVQSRDSELKNPINDALKCGSMDSEFRWIRHPSDSRIGCTAHCYKFISKTVLLCDLFYLVLDFVDFLAISEI